MHYIMISDQSWRNAFFSIILLRKWVHATWFIHPCTLIGSSRLPALAAGSV